MFNDGSVDKNTEIIRSNQSLFEEFVWNGCSNRLLIFLQPIKPSAQSLNREWHIEKERKWTEYIEAVEVNHEYQQLIWSDDRYEVIQTQIPFLQFYQV